MELSDMALEYITKTDLAAVRIIPQIKIIKLLII